MKPGRGRQEPTIITRKRKLRIASPPVIYSTLAEVKSLIEAIEEARHDDRPDLLKQRLSALKEIRSLYGDKAVAAVPQEFWKL